MVIYLMMETLAIILLLPLTDATYIMSEKENGYFLSDNN